MIQEINELISATQTVGNRAVQLSGYNKPYTFAPNLTVSYELYTFDPTVPYHSQYLNEEDLNEEELDERVDREPRIRDEEWCWESEKPVFILQGKDGFRCALYTQDPWEDELRHWLQADGGMLR